MPIKSLLFTVVVVLCACAKLYNASQVAIEAVTSKLPNGPMTLRGSACGLSWDKGVDMVLLSGGGNGDYHYRYTADCDAGVSTLEVKALDSADTRWMLGANHHISLKNSTATSTSFYPWFHTYSTPQQVIKNVRSNELNNTRDIIMYFPPSYNENTLKTYKNILIMHDGNNLFDPKTSAFGCWNAQVALNDAANGGNSDEIVVVGVYNTPDRNNEYTYVYDPSEGFGGKGDLYLDFLESTVIPLIQKTYPRLVFQRETLGILGSSLGGLISCYAGWTRNVYGKVGCMSSSFWWDDQDYQKNVLVNNKPSTPLPHIYIDSGTGSTGEIQCTEYSKQIYNYELSYGFVENQNAFKYVQDGGQHNEASWGSRFDKPISDLYPPTTV